MTTVEQTRWLFGCAQNRVAEAAYLCRYAAEIKACSREATAESRRLRETAHQIYEERKQLRQETDFKLPLTRLCREQIMTVWEMNIDPSWTEQAG